MGCSRFLLLLLVSYLIFLLPAVYGYGRVKTSYSSDEPQRTEEYSRKTRVFSYPIEDYSEPEPNTNPKNGYIFSPPSPVPAPPPHAAK